MSNWTTDELRRIGGATELQVASFRPDGTLRPYVTIWTVTAGDGVYVRSAYGSDNPWFRRALHPHHATAGPACLTGVVSFVPGPRPCWEVPG